MVVNITDVWRPTKPGYPIKQGLNPTVAPALRPKAANLLASQSEAAIRRTRQALRGPRYRLGSKALVHIGSFVGLTSAPARAGLLI